MPRRRPNDKHAARVAATMAAFETLDRQRRPMIQVEPEELQSPAPVPGGPVFDVYHKIDAERLDEVAPGAKERYGIFKRAMAGRSVGVVALEDLRIGVLPAVDVAAVVAVGRISTERFYDVTVGRFSKVSYKPFDAEVMIREFGPQNDRTRTHLGVNVASSRIQEQQKIAFRALRRYGVNRVHIYREYAAVVDLGDEYPYGEWAPIQREIDMVLPPGTVLPFAGLQVELVKGDR